MTSVVDICNIALSNIRAGSINSLDESNPEAQLCKLKYPIVRDMVIANMDWQFSSGVKTLALLSATELFNWSYAYQYPVDSFGINRLIGEYEEISTDSGTAVISQARQNLIDSELRSVEDLRMQIPYEIFNVDGNRVIGANEPNLRIDYRIKITDPNLFSPQLVISVAHLLASEIAIPIVGGELGRQFRADSLSLYQNYLDAAISSDMNEQYHSPGDSEYVTIRR